MARSPMRRRPCARHVGVRWSAAMPSAATGMSWNSRTNGLPERPGGCERWGGIAGERGSRARRVGNAGRERETLRA